MNVGLNVECQAFVYALVYSCIHVNVPISNSMRAYIENVILSINDRTHTFACM